jgi:hypothetical protein
VCLGDRSRGIGDAAQRPGDDHRVDAAVRDMAPLFPAPESNLQWLAVLVRGESYPIDQVDEIDLPSINRRILRQHKGVGFPLVFSAVDISLIEDSARKTEPFWQAGVFSLVFGSSDRVRRGLKDLARGTNTMPFSLYFPESIRPRDGAEFVYWVERGGWKKIVRMLDPPQIGEAPLSPAQLRELERCLARYEMLVRCVLTGCRREKDRIKLNPGVQDKLEEMAST